MIQARNNKLSKISKKSYRMFCRNMTPITSRIQLKKFSQITIGVPKETHAVEKSAALDAYTVQRLVDAGFKVNIESCAGEKSYITDDLYAYSGAKITDAAEALGAALVIKGLLPTEEQATLIRPNSALIW